MAEKKVSSKNKSGIPVQPVSAKKEKNLTREHYDDFVSEYSARLRKRSTQTIGEPKKRNIYDRYVESDSSRCGEIDPHTTVNPAVRHNIMTRRTGRILSDDTGFKADSYNDRFELTEEMPDKQELSQGETESELISGTVPGQQTMADLISADASEEEMIVPVESNIPTAQDDMFASAYSQMKKEGINPGRSEKLRAIARTAADDAGMEPDSQLVFPTFDPLFRFPEKEEEEKEKKSKIKKHSKEEKPHKEKKEKRKEAAENFDIDESTIVTVHSQQEDEDDDAVRQAQERQLLMEERKRRFFEFMKDNKPAGEVEPLYEVSDKSEIRKVSQKLSAAARTSLIKTGILFLFAFITFIISVVFDSDAEGNLRAVPFIYSLISFLCLLASGGVCIKEFAEGIKDISKKHITLNLGGLIIFAAAFVQSIASFFALKSYPGTVHIVTSAAIFSLITIVAPRFLLSNNSRLALGMFSGQGSVTILKKASQGGTDGVLNEKYASENGGVRYAERVSFATGLMKRLTNAVPKAFGVNAIYVFILVFAVVVAIAAGIICKSAITGITAFSAMIIVCVPVSYSLSAAFVLYNTNSRLAASHSSLLSYRCAQELSSADSFILDGTELTEGSACSIHGIKAFGRTDPRKSTLYCASAVNAANSPLKYIMQQVTEQSGEEVPVADEYIVRNFKGIAAIVDGNNILLGSRDFLEENNVDIPSEDFEEKFITGDRKLLYLSVNGEFSMLLIVSYHIKRSVSAFVKYLSARKINLILHSCDPNITPEFIAKKCKVSKDNIFASDDAEGSYLQAKSGRTESALPADVFTDGKLSSLSLLIRNAAALNVIIDKLPLIVYVFSAIGALLIAAPVLLGSIYTVSNIYLIAIRIVCFAATVVFSLLAFKNSGVEPRLYEKKK